MNNMASYQCSRWQEEHLGHSTPINKFLTFNEIALIISYAVVEYELIISCLQETVI